MLDWIDFPSFLNGTETWTLKLKYCRKIDPWTTFRINFFILKELGITKRLIDNYELLNPSDISQGRNFQGQVEGKRSRGLSPIRKTDLIK